MLILSMISCIVSSGFGTCRYSNTPSVTMTTKSPFFQGYLFMLDLGVCPNADRQGIRGKTCHLLPVPDKASRCSDLVKIRRPIIEVYHAQVNGRIQIALPFHHHRRIHHAYCRLQGKPCFQKTFHKIQHHLALLACGTAGAHAIRKSEQKITALQLQKREIVPRNLCTVFFQPCDSLHTAVFCILVKQKIGAFL